MRIFRGLALLGAVPMLVAAREPVKLPPSSKWVIDYANDSCRLLRTFGSGEDASTLILERVSPGDGMSMLVVGKPFQASSFARDFEAVFLPDEKAKAKYGASAKTAEGGRQPAILWNYASFTPTLDVKVPTAAMRKARSVAMKGERPAKIDEKARLLAAVEARTVATRATSLEVRRRGTQSVILETGSMGTPNKMMEDCARNQLKNWGVDPELEDRIAQRPWGNLMGVLTYADYPRESLWKGRESALTVRLLVDAKGKLSDCTALSAVADDAFPKSVCAAFLDRGKLNPAELADGTAVPSYYIQRVQFRTGY